MKILLLERIDGLARPGGDMAQLAAIQKALQGWGYLVRRVSSLSPVEALYWCDLVVVMNLTRPFETFMQVTAIKAADKPYLLCPVYWDFSSFLEAHTWDSPGWYALKKVAPPFVRRLLRAAWHCSLGHSHHRLKMLALMFRGGEKALMAYILEGAAVVAPNSEAERLHLLARFAGVDMPGIAVIHNGIDVASLPSVEMIGQTNRIRRIICAGGLGPRKNQLTLVRAARYVNVPFLIVGNPAPGSERYARQVKKEAPQNVKFIDQMPQSKVYELMLNSAVYCQPSFIETPGLASLEAGALGASLALGDSDPVREVFASHALYFDPNDERRMADTILQALNRSVDSTMQAEWFRRQYDWTVTLEPLENIITSMAL